MIRLQKGPIPKVLAENGLVWFREFEEARTAGERVSDAVRYRYRHSDIKDAVRRDSHSKCTYCESLVEFGEIDHVNPVSKRPDQILEWENLVLVCKECNTNKGSYYEPEAPLINPFVNDPSDHLIFFGPQICESPGDMMGYRTIHQIQLNRVGLFEKRKRRIERLMPLAHQWHSHVDGATKDLLRHALEDEAIDSQEFAATARGFLRSVLGW